ncbi:LuxR C-terminal-related transcriptional regulator [Vibrio sp. HN007]|uniref:LuxR C-terminal-related transcriptional regulator n=1 Tax=Vibrio iocasae TaxID=3098914 RepID=UPI0035D4439F
MFEVNKIVYLQPEASSSSTYTPTPLELLILNHFETRGLKSLPAIGESDKTDSTIFVINYQSVQLEELKELILEKILGRKTIIINGPESIQTSELITLGHVRGFFLSNENEPTFLGEIKKISKGGYRIPEHIAAQLLRYYQSVLLRHTEPLFTNLTQREIEVLQYLKEGVSNNSLADQLFVSEHTVKSHLYKIFRKLKVKNRTQAIEWAHKFLP